MNIIIRSERQEDIDSVAKVTIEAFLNAPHTDHTEQYVVRELRNAGALIISLVAEYQGAIIGHVAVSPVCISDNSENWFGLGPISVSPNHQSFGIGTKLMRAALGALKELNAAGCVVLGDPAYYKRFGFKPDPRLTLLNVPSEYFQAIHFSSLLPDGEVTYHEAFNAKN